LKRIRVHFPKERKSAKPLSCRRESGRIHEEELHAGHILYSILLFIEVIDTATRLHGATIYVTKSKISGQ
jgi:hypothetical protein